MREDRVEDLLEGSKENVEEARWLETGLHGGGNGCATRGNLDMRRIVAVSIWASSLGKSKAVSSLSFLATSSASKDEDCVV